MPDDQFDRLMRTIKDSSAAMDRKLLQFKEDRKRGQAEVADRVAKKARRERAYEFNRKDNQFQHDFNCQVADVLEDV